MSNDKPRITRNPEDSTLSDTDAPVIPGLKATVADAPASPGRTPDGTAILSPGHAAGAPLSTDAESFVGRELAGYLIERKLAEGGMGVVYAGAHTKIGRRGAIKVLKLELCRNEEVVQRFYQEARSVNAIRHEGIVDVYDFGRDPEGRVFFVMELLEGESLGERLRRGPLSWPEAYPILEQTLRALKAAHDKGFVHRDLKPDNIWLRPRSGGEGVSVKLLDFGIAKLVGLENAAEKLTRTGSIIGTPHYMSPEQISGKSDVDHRTDLYAMGIIAYELFAGVTPFPGENLGQIITSHLMTIPPRLVNLPRSLKVPAPIADIVDRLLAKKPEERYPSVAEVLADLQAVAQDRLPIGVSSKQAKPQTKSKSKAPWYIGAGFVAVAGAAAGIVASQNKGPAVATTPAVIAPVSTAAVSSAPISAPATSAAVPKPVDSERLRGEAEALLRGSLKETEPRVRAQGSDALGEVNDKASAPALTELVGKDPDGEVRGHAAAALGQLGVHEVARQLADQEKSAPTPLKVWLAQAQARLGDEEARRRLAKYAEDKDLGVSFKAALALAEVSKPGDEKAIKALTRLAAREAELNNVAPYAGAVLLSRLAGLRVTKARTALYAILEMNDEAARLAAAEALARVGDEAGRPILKAILDTKDSPNRLIAAVTLVSLGDYSGFELIKERLADKDPETRRLAARGLGMIGERATLEPLSGGLTDAEWRVRIAAAVAVLVIVGLDPDLLAQDSVDWASTAILSEDWTTRRAAARVIGDMPEKHAVPLLAAAIADPDPKVRVVAARSAGRLRGDAAVAQVARAAKQEKDVLVKEEQVKSLGLMGNGTARETLVELSSDTGRVGVFASGSLVAVGDMTGAKRLEAAVLDKRLEIRQAAVEAAGYAKNPVVIPTLVLGIADRVLEIRFAAAEGLIGLNAEKAKALPVMQEGLGARDLEIVARARAGLLVLGEPATKGMTAKDMLASNDARVRKGAMREVAVMSIADALPLLRQAMHDSDEEVRDAGADAFVKLSITDKEALIRFGKTLTGHRDAHTRALLKAQLAKLVERPEGKAAITPTDVPKLKAAHDATQTALAQLRKSVEDAERCAKDVEEATRAPAKDDAAVRRVTDLAKECEEAGIAVADAHRKTVDAARQAALHGGDAPDAAASELLRAAGLASQEAHEGLRRARLAAPAAEKAKKFAQLETGDPAAYLAAAEAAILAGRLGEAKSDLDRAARELASAGTELPALSFAYAQLYEKMAASRSDDDKLRYLKQALDHYQTFARKGSGTRLRQAQIRMEEITEEIKELETR
jgi:serine/threonine protein kinase/HEAT repeat protein